MLENDLLYEFYRDAADLSEMSNTIATYMTMPRTNDPTLKYSRSVQDGSSTYRS